MAKCGISPVDASLSGRCSRDEGGVAVMCSGSAIAIEAEVLGVPMWLGSATGQFYSFAMSQGYGAADVTSLARIFDDWAKIRDRAD